MSVFVCLIFTLMNGYVLAVLMLVAIATLQVQYRYRYATRYSVGDIRAMQWAWACMAVVWVLAERGLVDVDTMRALLRLSVAVLTASQIVHSGGAWRLAWDEFRYWLNLWHQRRIG